MLSKIRKNNILKQFICQSGCIENGVSVNICNKNAIVLKVDDYFDKNPPKKGGNPKSIDCLIVCPNGNKCDMYLIELKSSGGKYFREKLGGTIRNLIELNAYHCIFNTSCIRNIRAIIIFKETRKNRGLIPELKLDIKRDEKKNGKISCLSKYFCMEVEYSGYKICC